MCRRRLLWGRRASGKVADRRNSRMGRGVCRRVAAALVVCLLGEAAWGVRAPYAVAGGWTFDRETLVWTYHESETPTNRLEDLKKGWFHDPFDGYWYYFRPSDGHMVYGMQRIDGRDYRFMDIRDRGNYFPEDDGFWYYRANGLIPFGAMLAEVKTDRDESAGGSGGSSNAGKSDDERRPAAEPETKTEVSEEEKQPIKPDEPEVEKPSEPAISETKPPESEKEAELEPEEVKPEPSEPQPKPDPEPELPYEPCIVTDSWEEILAHPTIYETCLLEQCEKELLVKGYRVVQEEAGALPVATGSDVVAVPVSIIGIGVDGAGTATFAAAELCDAFAMPMSASPYFCFQREETFDAFSTGGWARSIGFAALNGGSYSFALDEDTTLRTKFSGFQLFYGDAKTGKKKRIRPFAVEKVSGNGYLFEMAYEGRDGYGTPEQGFAKRRVKSALWLLSEQELSGAHDNSIAGEGVHYPYAKQVDGAYWLRSAAYHGAGAEEGAFVSGDGTLVQANEVLPLRFAFVVK